MTLGELIDRYRPHLDDDSVMVRRSWEETFAYALRYFPSDTPLDAFDLDALAAKLTASGIQPRFVDGYITRWRNLIARAHEL